MEALALELASIHKRHLQLEDDLIDHRQSLLAPSALLSQLETLQARATDLSQAVAYFAMPEKAETLAYDFCSL